MTETNNPPLRRLHAIAHGRVQGVNFRAYAVRKADSLGLTGWVRNTATGAVETMAEGTEATLNEFLEFLRVGPPSASVTRVDIAWEEATGTLDSFQIHHFPF